MKLTTLEDLYVAELQDLHSAETQIARHLPKVIEAIQNEQLRHGLSSHLEETKQQIQRVREILEELNKDPNANVCEATQGLLKEADEIIQATDKGPIRDLGLAGSALRVEHYEQAGYETAALLANTLQYLVHVDILSQTLIEEQLAAEKISEIASTINVGAQGMEFQVPTEDGRLKIEGKPEATGSYVHPPEDAHQMIEADDEENIYQDEDLVDRSSGASG